MTLLLATPDIDPRQPVYSETALTLPEDFTYEEWQSLGESLQQMERSVQWWLGDWWNYGERKYGELSAQAIKDTTGYSYQTVHNAAYVASRFEFSRRRENLTWSHHSEVAGQEPDRADDWLDRAEREEWKRNQLRAELRSDRLHRELVAAPLPTEIFNLVYADPPWQYEFVETDNRAIENQYPTMTLDQIRDMPVRDLVADNAILFLWATSPKLDEALSVVGAWGFDYRTNLVWVKDKIGMGYYARQQHELLLVCRRGEFPTPRPEDRPSSVIEAPRVEHSRKPDEVYGLIERMYPSATRLELFARRERDGWTSWGNQVGGV